MRAWGRLLGRVVLVLAVFVAGFLGAKLGMLGTREVGASHNFNDVPPGAFYHDFVQFLVENGITAGCGPGLFCGEQAVTRGQTAVFLKKLSDVIDAKVDAKLTALAACPPDSVKVGPTCIDTYEASVWETTDAALIQKIKAGTVTLAELQASAVRRDADFGPGCPPTGTGCTNLYAVSVAGLPSSGMTWFQAAAVARNAGKRLPTNAEWQAAALGTPDGPPCIVGAGNPGPTGTPGCLSNVGAFDMVGNLEEWVADWLPYVSGNCIGAPTLFGTGDLNCLAANSIGDGPAGLKRGGAYFSSSILAGVFAIRTSEGPASPSANHGFRAAR